MKAGRRMKVPELRHSDASQSVAGVRPSNRERVVQPTVVS